MIYGFSPHTEAATSDLELQGLPCRRKGCGCIPYDHKVHSKKAREDRKAAEAAVDAALEGLLSE